MFAISPISLVRPVVRDEAKAFGLYPSSSAARSTLARIFSDTEAPSVNVRDTAERETPARSATSLRVGPGMAAVLAEKSEGSNGFARQARRCRALRSGI